MRNPSPTDFLVPVEGIGTFTFGRRTMKDEIKIQVEYARLIDGAPATEWLSRVCGWISTLSVMTVRAPEGWDISEMDPLDDDVYAQMFTVFVAMRAKEDSFRKKPGVGSEASSEAALPNN